MAWVEDCEYYVLKATITSNPIINANECVVFVIYMEQNQMAFIGFSKDTTWTYIRTENESIADFIHCRGDPEDKVYALGSHGNLLTFNINTSDFNSDVNSLECGIPPNSFIRKYILWIHMGLMIDRACNWEDPEELKKCFAKEFKVYKFNFDKCLWIEKKETLGDDVALFVGDNLSIRVVASKFPGCKQNSMYYNHDFDEIDFHDYMLNDFGVYEMETKSISKPCSSHVMTLLEMVNHRPIWFTPTFQL
ncbi:PREDICTED: uncharacterized protein LOC101299793 [Fragaria vesca subsp. vesca]|uniref:uncharacterized protein LOC101299793 n=1 Tax=Fragaria vesca subsp. vesca TaxID=101020 RepID=UPI0002C33BE7|nr:PREDICTED: uncharacterized protein LOC101299793 [Fragaria vesca subsp. vesca]